MCRIIEELTNKVAAEAAAEATAKAAAEAATKAAETVRKMLAKNFSIEDIAECTDLSVEEVKELASQS